MAVRAAFPCCHTPSPHRVPEACGARRSAARNERRTTKRIARCSAAFRRFVATRASAEARVGVEART